MSKPKSPRTNSAAYAPASKLPAHPNLDYLKKLAKRHAAASRKAAKPLTLALAQLAIARQFGFTSWRALKTHVESTAPTPAASINLPHIFRDLMKAIANRDMPALHTLLSAAPQVVNMNGPHPHWGGRPQPLHVAIESGNCPAFDALIAAGADINSGHAEYGRWSPLMLAIHWKRSAMRDELLRRKADVSLITALMLKADRRVARLLKDPAALKGPFPNDATPLHFAATPKAAKLLLAAGVDPTIKDTYGRTAADSWASRKPLPAGLMKLAATFTNAPPPNTTDIVKAVEQRRLTLVRKLLAAGVDINTRTPSGSKGTLLHSAAWNGDLPMVKLLVSKGADLRAIDEEHKTTPAHWARVALTLFVREPCRAVAEYLDASMTNSAPKQPCI